MAKASKAGRNKKKCEKYQASLRYEKHRDIRMLKKLKELEKLHPENLYELQDYEVQTGRGSRKIINIVRTTGKKPRTKKQRAKRLKNQVVIAK